MTRTANGTAFTDVFVQHDGSLATTPAVRDRLGSPGWGGDGWAFRTPVVGGGPC